MSREAAWRWRITRELVATEGRNAAWQHRVAMEAIGGAWHCEALEASHDRRSQGSLAMKVVKEAVTMEGCNEAWQWR